MSNSLFSEPPSDTLANVAPGGAPPKRRINSVEAARSVYDDCLLDAEPAARVRARIRGLVDGNQPYNPEELKRLGQSWRTNVNFREAEAIIDTNSAALWEMQQDLYVLARFTPRNPSLGYSPDNGLDYGSVISEEYTRTLRGWSGFTIYNDLVIHDSMESGMGAFLWRDEMTYRPDWFNISNFVFPKKAKCELSKLDFFFLRDEIQLADLYNYVESPEIAAQLGWNDKAVKALLVRLFIGGDANASGSPDDEFQMSPWESMQQKLKNNDSDVQRRQFEGVKVVRMFVRELSGNQSITQYIFTEDDTRADGVDPSQEEPAPDTFLFEKSGQYQSMSQCLWCLLYSYGDGYLRSVKGLGHRIAPHCELSNRFIGQTFDSGTLSASLLLQPKSGVDYQKLQIIRTGAITYLPENLQTIQTSFAPRMDGLLMMRDMSTAILNNNTGVFKIKNENPMKREAEKTAKQVMSEEGKEARFEKNQAAYFYVQADLLHQEIARRLFKREYAESALPYEGKKEAKAFRDRCLARGVPESLLDPELWDIKAERALGLGSPGMRLDVTGQLLSIKGMLPEEKQGHVVREFIAARAGWDQVDRYFPLLPKDVFSSDAGSIATLENNDFAEGSWVPVGSDQLHATHLRVHFVPLLQIAEVVASSPEKLDPRKAYPVFANAIPHIQQHLGFMAKDHLPEDAARAAKLKEYVALFRQMQEVMTNLELMVKNLEKQDQQEQVQTQKQMIALQQEIERKNVEVEKYKIDEQMKLEKYKADQLNVARVSKSDTSIQVAVQRALADMANKQRLVEAQIAALAAKTGADVSAKAMKSQSSATPKGPSK